MTAILVTVIFLLGMSRVRQAAQRKVDPVLRNLAERNSVCELSGSVTEAPEERGEDHLIQARISRVAVNDTVYSVSRLVLIRFRKFQPVMDYGDLFTVVALLRRPSQARNPGAFDYRSFVERKDITATATVRKPEDILETEGGGHMDLVKDSASGEKPNQEYDRPEPLRSTRGPAERCSPQTEARGFHRGQ